MNKFLRYLWKKKTVKLTYKILVKIFVISKLVKFIHDYCAFKKLSVIGRFQMNLFNCSPKLYDNTLLTDFDAHYVYHTALAAYMVKKINPTRHIDISSSLYFNAIVSAFIPVTFYDYRPANLNLVNLSTHHADLLHLPFDDNSITSISCMHVIEHIGLGRYGDALDPNGDLKAIAELRRVVSVGGNLIVVVPVGRPKIVFNAHRIYSYKQIIENFNEFTLVEYIMVPDNGVSRGVIYNATEEETDLQMFGCGCFWFIKN